MYHYNNFEAWRERRNELLQEAGERRLARGLRAVQSREKTHETRRPLLGLIAGQFSRSRKMAGC
jgi:hypothetical protein